MTAAYSNIAEKSIRLCTTDIVSAYVLHNAIPSEDLPGLISRISAALSSIPAAANANQALGAAITGQLTSQDGVNGLGGDAQPIGGVATQPAVAVPSIDPEESIQDEWIQCLECGKRFKSLKRHLTAAHGLTAEEYRIKWGLPAEYPLVARNYTALRAKIAKETDLGNSRSRARASS